MTVHHLPTPARTRPPRRGKRTLRRAASVLLIAYCAGWLLSLLFFSAGDAPRAGGAGGGDGLGVEAVLRALCWPAHGVRWLLGRGSRPGGDTALAPAGAARGGSPALRPVRYPRLLECMKGTDAMEVAYQTEAGALDVLLVRRKGRRGIVVERDAHVSIGGAAAQGRGPQPGLSTLIDARVIMTDRGGDGSLDAVEIRARDWRDDTEYTEEIQGTRDSAFAPFWDEALNIIYRESGCFR